MATPISTESRSIESGSRAYEQARRQRRARSNSRGAVAVEALIVTGMLITALGAAVVLHRVYSTHMTMLNEARLAAWQPAIAGCGDAPQADPASGMVTDAAQSEEPDVSMDGTEGWMLVTTHEESRGKSVMVFGNEKQVGAKRSVACNEVKPRDLGIKSLLQRIGGVFTSE